jgi:hypothetical protein
VTVFIFNLQPSLRFQRFNAFHEAPNGVYCVPMGHCKGKDNVRKRASRRKKTDRLALAKAKATPPAK